MPCDCNDDDADDQHNATECQRNFNPCLRGVYRGVTYDRRCKKWRARLYGLGRHIALGRFSDAERAAEVHDLAAYYVFREAAATNFGIATARDSLQRLPVSQSKHVTRGLRALKVAVAQQQKHRFDADSTHAHRKRAAIAAGAVVSEDDAEEDDNGSNRSKGDALSKRSRNSVRVLVRLAIVLS